MAVRLPATSRASVCPERCQRILGIDPGTVVTGWGLVETAQGAASPVAHGTIRSSPHDGQEIRLRRIYSGLTQILARYQPDAISLEKVFFARDPQSALKLGQVRGVALLAAAETGVAVYEYSWQRSKKPPWDTARRRRNRLKRWCERCWVCGSGFSATRPTLSPPRCAIANSKRSAGASWFSCVPLRRRAVRASSNRQTLVAGVGCAHDRQHKGNHRKQDSGRGRCGRRRAWLSNTRFPQRLLPAAGNRTAR